MNVIRAILLMILSMALLALSDMFIKLALETLPRGQVMFLVSAGGTLFFLLIARLQGAPIRSAAFWSRTVITRNLLEIAAGVSILYALATVPLPIFAAVMQAAPLVVTIGAALFLREKVGWRRWSAVLIGLVGMLIILRPGSAAFTPNVIWAVLAVTALALRDLVTRLAPGNVASITLSTWGFAVTIPVGALLMTFENAAPSLDIRGWLYAFGGIVVTTLGYYAITSAMRMAPASIVAPFRYARLIFTTAVAIAVFDQWPDTPTLVGAGIIIASGLYSFARERRLAKVQR